MNEQEQRIAILEAIGWTRFPRADDTQFDPPRWLSPDKEMTHTLVSMPNPLTDLNAMHEAERQAPLGLVRCDQYESLLKEIQRRDFRKNEADRNPETRVAELYIWHATAPQRAEAFLKTLGLWKEEPQP